MEGAAPPDSLAPHVVLDEANHTFWVPVRDANDVLRRVANFLTEHETQKVLFQVEHEAGLLGAGGKTIETAEGQRGAVRAAMRRLLTQDADGDDAPEGHQDVAMVNLDWLLELMMELLAVRVSRMRSEFRKLFISGDDNGDGELSFQEFMSLIARAAPHFSERRVLRMFREALTSGAEASSSAIDPSTFAAVCKAHGLVKLIDEQQ